MPKALSCRWAATSLDRFSVETIANLVPGASRSTVSDVVASLLREGHVFTVDSAGRTVRGRPRKEYSWVDGRRLALRQTLERELVGLRESSGPDIPDHAMRDMEPASSFEAGLEQIKALVDIAKVAETPAQRQRYDERARAEYDVLRSIDPTDARLREAERQLSRLNSSARPPLLSAPERSFWTRVLEEARAPIKEVFEHLNAPAHHPVVAHFSGPHVRESSLQAHSEGAYSVILNTSRDTPAWMEEFATRQGHDCVVLKVSDLSIDEMDEPFGKLLTHLVTPVSANTRLTVVADDSERSRQSLALIGRVFGDPSAVRAAIESSADLLIDATNAAALSDEIYQFVGVAPEQERPEWLERGLARRFVLRTYLAREHVSTGALLKAAMNDPLFVIASPLKFGHGKEAFGQVRIATPQDVVARLHAADEGTLLSQYSILSESARRRTQSLSFKGDMGELIRDQW